MWEVVIKLYQNKLLRRMVLPLLARLPAGDISIKHHYTGDLIRLHSYRHKGYWYHGRRREQDSMRLFQTLIPKGAEVIEVGGHIGYVTLHLASAVGAQGHVYVFEPGPNNLPYLLHNTQGHTNITVVAEAAGRFQERRAFHIEGLTGQNNSFLPDFEALATNIKNSFATSVHRDTVTVGVVTLDDFCTTHAVCPYFIKIDVEGFEIEVLRGAAALLRNAPPMLMVEISRNQREVFELLRQVGYCLFPPAGAFVARAEELGSSAINIFCLHEVKHAHVMARLARAAAPLGHTI